MFRSAAGANRLAEATAGIGVGIAPTRRGAGCDRALVRGRRKRVCEARTEAGRDEAGTANSDRRQHDDVSASLPRIRRCVRGPVPELRVKPAPSSLDLKISSRTPD